MIQLIIGIIAIIIAIAIIKKLFSFIGGVLAIAIGLVASTLFGVQGGLAYITHRATSGKNLERKTSLLMFFATCMISALIVLSPINDSFHTLNIYYNDLSFTSLKSVFSAIILFAAYKSVCKINEFKDENSQLEFPAKIHSTVVAASYFSFFMFVSSAFSPCVGKFAKSTLDMRFISTNIIWWFDLLFWIVATLSALYAIATTSDCIKIFNQTKNLLKGDHKTKVDTLTKSMKEDGNCIDDEKISEFIDEIIGHGVIKGEYVELNLPSGDYVFESETYNKLEESIKNKASITDKVEIKTIKEIIKNELKLDNKDSDEYADKYVRFGSSLRFSDGIFFVINENMPKFKTCASCGVTEVIGQHEPFYPEWFCSEICKETNQSCMIIKEKKHAEFLSDAGTSGFILMKGAEAWNSNHKVMAANGQGHGFAAENANNMIDKLKGKHADVVGGDNVKNGADRIVNGQEIQTKYCATAARSVGAGFDGNSGNYKYIDSNGKPMVLEVPKDQYELAVKTMEEKIKEGKVPGVNDPTEAKDIVRAGSITYEQAKNITKFGTIDSITYDVAEGAVVSAAAGGISFCITAIVYYSNTKDRNKSLQAASIQAGKTFGKTLCVYVSTQQLHRIALVQKTLGKIDISSVSPRAKNFLKNGFGVESTEGVNKAIRGTLVTSIAIIAISTGPDMIKLIRGRISKAQFVKNLSVTSSSVAGGAIGAVAGGAICSPLGPVGMIIGRIAGGIVGGIISSSIASAVADTLMVDDKVKMLNIIQQQMTYLAISFMLSKDEVDNLNENLSKVITEDTLEVLYQRKAERYALANYYIKPIVVGIIKQRPALHYDNSDLTEIYSGWEKNNSDEAA